MFLDEVADLILQNSEGSVRRSVAVPKHGEGQAVLIREREGVGWSWKIRYVLEKIIFDREFRLLQL